MLDKDGTPQTEEVEIKIPAFRAVSVFDVSQTDGEPLPELEAKELLSTVEGYEDFINAITYVAPAPIGFEDIPGASKGYFNIEENRIAVQEGMSESQTLKTMVHETAHSMLHNKEVNKEDIIDGKPLIHITRKGKQRICTGFHGMERKISRIQINTVSVFHLPHNLSSFAVVNLNDV